MLKGDTRGFHSIIVPSQLNSCLSGVGQAGASREVCGNPSLQSCHLTTWVKEDQVHVLHTRVLPVSLPGCLSTRLWTPPGLPRAGLPLNVCGVEELYVGHWNSSQHHALCILKSGQGGRPCQRGLPALSTGTCFPSRLWLCRWGRTKALGELSLPSSHRIDSPHQQPELGLKSR